MSGRGPSPPRGTTGGKLKEEKKSRSRRSRSRSGSRSPSPKKDRSRRKSRSRTPPPRKSSSERQMERQQREEKKRLDEEEKKRIRLESSVFVSQIHPKVTERDLFDFFSMVGQVEDIKLIRDVRTGKSKGLSYVEFAQKDSLVKASALTNQLLMGYPITVQIVPPTAVASATASAEAMKLYIGSLHFSITEADIRPMFEAFGPLDFLDVQRESGGQSKGYGFVQFKKAADARQAMASLNGIDIGGRQMRVSLHTEKGEPAPSSSFGGGMGRGGVLPGGDNVGSILEEEEGGAPLSAQSRTSLMQKLSRGQALPTPVGGPSSSSSSSSSSYGSSIPTPVLITTCVVVKNMFDPAKETEPDFDMDIKEDVENECGRNGKILHVFVDKSSAGHVYIRFSDKSGAEATVKQFHGRWFAGRQISAEYLSESTYKMKFPEQKF